MLEAELTRLRHYNASIVQMLDRFEEHLAQPLPSAPPFQVLSDLAPLAGPKP